MRSVVVPTLVALGRSRAWTNGQIAALQAVQTYALQRCFGLDKLWVRDHHITTEQLRLPNGQWWISTVLKAADIHKMHWFKLAQNHDPTKWDALIGKAFPRKWLTKTANARLNRWRPGQPLPDNSLLRIRQTRRVWTKPASRIARTECPECEELCPNAHALRTHYRNQHAVTGLTITTIAMHTCKECLKSFPSAFAPHTTRMPSSFLPHRIQM